MQIFSYFIAKFSQVSGICWILLGLYAGIVKGSMKWEFILFIVGILLFVGGYLLEKLVVRT